MEQKLYKYEIVLNGNVSFDIPTKRLFIKMQCSIREDTTICEYLLIAQMGQQYYRQHIRVMIEACVCECAFVQQLRMRSYLACLAYPSVQSSGHRWTLTFGVS